MSKYSTPKELFTATCDSIRSKTGKTELINHEDIPSEIDSIADANKKPYIDTSLITDWRYFFQNDYRSSTWDFENTDFSGAENFYYCFSNFGNSDAAARGKDIYVNAPKATIYSYAFRMSHFNKVTLDAESALEIVQAFNGSLIKEVEFIKPPKKCATFANCFQNCKNLISIKGLDFSGVTEAPGITNTFANCPKLVDCVITGTLKILSSNFRINGCSKLSRESVVSFANAILDNTGGTTQTLYFGAANLAKLTEEEKTALINKNFVLA